MVERLRGHSSWVVNVIARQHAYELVSGSVEGEVTFWDLRSSLPRRTFQAQRSHMTSLVVHPSAHIFATGSHDQYIKVFTLNGVNLQRILYHDGFLGQRIGPVSCLDFHPTKMLLATGSTDSIASLYSTNIYS